MNNTFGCAAESTWRDTGMDARRLVPVVDADGADERRTGDDGHVLRFAPVRVPRAHEPGPMVADRVEALHAGKVEIVDEPDFAAIVDGESAG